MPMNYLHRKICGSTRWAADVAERMPEQLAGIELGDDVLEIGPGFGATTRALVSHITNPRHTTKPHHTTKPGPTTKPPHNAKPDPATGPGTPTGAARASKPSRTAKLTAVEIDEASVALLRAEFADRVEIVHGDGARLPFPDGRFSAVVCFTMLHHVPSTALQDALFAEACRVLRPGGVFRGADSLPNLRFRLLHIGDTMVALDPVTLPGRLYRAGFEEVASQHRRGRQIRFLAHKA